jgi:hypothetical protein
MDCRGMKYNKGCFVVSPGDELVREDKEWTGENEFGKYLGQRLGKWQKYMENYK